MKPGRDHIFHARGLLLLCLTAALVLVSRLDSPAFGQASPANVSGPNASCLSCHSNPDMTTTLADGEVFSIFVDPQKFAGSVHGQNGAACTSCHGDITGFPHPELTVETSRELIIRYNEACAQCHSSIREETMGSVHEVALDAGNNNAAACSDCHGAHDVRRPSELRVEYSLVCRKCHSDVYDMYAGSVHGEALRDYHNLDVPSCVDCHGAHKIDGPLHPRFHLFSPKICEGCHSNRELMDKYGFRSDIYRTYMTDFHGATIFFDQVTAPDQGTDKPVCIDCHGVHDIRTTDDPLSSVAPANILETCKRCHPNAAAGFESAFLNHIPPSAGHAPLVFYVNWFYILLIPSLIGGMLVFVISDYVRQLIDFRRGTRHG